MILRLMLHLLGCKKETKMFASSGNRTRAARVAGEHSTTEPTMLSYEKGQNLGYLKHCQILNKCQEHHERV